MPFQHSTCPVGYSARFPTLPKICQGRTRRPMDAPLPERVETRLRDNVISTVFCIHTTADE
jgi:hypothetical protein